MSHFTSVATEFKDVQILVSALKECRGWDAEIHEHPQHLCGYLGDIRPQTATVIIRRSQISAISNDIGFAYNPERGTYTAIVSEYDEQHLAFTPSLLPKLKQEYARQSTIATCTAQGWKYQEIREGNRIQFRIQPQIQQRR
jgi:hypothetical protein